MIPIPGLLQIILKECHEIVKMLRAPLVSLLPDRRNQPVFPMYNTTALITSSSHRLVCSGFPNILVHGCCLVTQQKRTSLRGTDPRGKHRRDSTVSFRLRLN